MQQHEQQHGQQYEQQHGQQHGRQQFNRNNKQQMNTHSDYNDSSHTSYPEHNNTYTDKQPVGRHQSYPVMNSNNLQKGNIERHHSYPMGQNPYQDVQEKMKTQQNGANDGYRDQPSRDDNYTPNKRSTDEYKQAYPSSGTEHYTDSAFHSSPFEGSNDYPQSPYTDEKYASQQEENSSDSEAEIEHYEDGGPIHRLSYVQTEHTNQQGDINRSMQELPSSRQLSAVKRPQDTISNISRHTNQEIRPQLTHRTSSHVSNIRSVSQSSITTKPPLSARESNRQSSRPSSERKLHNQKSFEHETDEYSQPKSLTAPVTHTKWNLKDLANQVQVPIHSTSAVEQQQEVQPLKPATPQRSSTYVEGVHFKPKPLKPLFRGSIGGAYEATFPEETVGFIDATIGIYEQACPQSQSHLIKRSFMSRNMSHI